MSHGRLPGLSRDRDRARSPVLLGCEADLGLTPVSQACSVTPRPPAFNPPQTSPAPSDGTNSALHFGFKLCCTTSPAPPSDRRRSRCVTLYRRASTINTVCCRPVSTIAHGPVRPDPRRSSPTGSPLPPNAPSIACPRPPGRRRATDGTAGQRLLRSLARVFRPPSGSVREHAAGRPRRYLPPVRVFERSIQAAAHRPRGDHPRSGSRIDGGRRHHRIISTLLASQPAPAEPVG